MIEVVYDKADHVKASVIAAFVRAKWPSTAVEITLTRGNPRYHIRCTLEERLDPSDIKAAWDREIGGAL